LIVLRRITDSPIYAAECRHHADYWYSGEWIGKERRAMILVSIWSAKGEGRVSRDQKVGDDGK
jgi:hypothetical protein